MQGYYTADEGKYFGILKRHNPGGEWETLSPRNVDGCVDDDDDDDDDDGSCCC